MRSDFFVKETRIVKLERVYGETKVEVDFLIKATAERDGRMVLASAKPARIRIDGKEIKLRENIEQTASR